MILFVLVKNIDFRFKKLIEFFIWIMSTNKKKYKELPKKTLLYDVVFSSSILLPVLVKVSLYDVYQIATRIE